MTYNLSLFQSSVSRSLDRYNQWKERTGNDSATFTTYLQLYTRGPNTLGQVWENLLEGGGNGDGTEGNTISFDRYVEQGDFIMFQTESGEVIKLNTKTGEVIETTEAELAAENGGESLLFGEDSLELLDIDFSGENAVDISTKSNQTSIKDIVNTYVENHGGTYDLTDIFGTESGQDANVIYGEDNLTMTVVQDGRAFYGSYSEDNGFEITEITKDNLDDFGITYDETRSIDSIYCTIDENNEVHISITYEDGLDTSSGDSSTGSGDPHFSLNGSQTFDFQGASGGSEGTYNLLEGDDVSLTAGFEQRVSGDNGATVMGQFSMSMNTDQGVVQFEYTSDDSLADGTYTLTLNGETITDPSAYGIEIVKSDNQTIVTYNGREFSFAGIDVTVSSLKEGESGLLTQSSGIADADYGASDYDSTNYNQLMVYSGSSDISAPVAVVNGDSDYINELAEGFISTVEAYPGRLETILAGASENLTEKPDYEYTVDPDTISGTTAEKAEILARLVYAALNDSTCTDEEKQQVVANWISLSSQAMLEDINSSEGGMASRFEEGNGYSASQWNEFMGTINFATSSADIDKDGVQDEVLDVDGDGQTDGFDLDHDGVLDENEKVRYNFGDYFKNDEGSYTF